MTAYRVTLVIDNIDIDDESLGLLSAEFSNVSAQSRYGLWYVTGTAEGNTQKMAGQAFTRGFKTLFPDAVLLRLDQDLVSQTEIATRVGQSLESVQAFIDGTDGPGGFPTPIGEVGDGIRIWPWASVVKWLTEAMSIDFGVNFLDPEASAAVDANLASRRLIGPDHSKGGL